MLHLTTIMVRLPWLFFSNCFPLFVPYAVAAKVISEPRTFKKTHLQMSWVKKEGPPEKEEKEHHPNQIEVHNVPPTVTDKLLGTYFEMAKSGGCNNAVAHCKQIETGVFTVTFHDPQGV